MVSFFFVVIGWVPLGSQPLDAWRVIVLELLLEIVFLGAIIFSW